MQVVLDHLLACNAAEERNPNSKVVARTSEVSNKSRPRKADFNVLQALPAAKEPVFLCIEFPAAAAVGNVACESDFLA